VPEPIIRIWLPAPALQHMHAARSNRPNCYLDPHLPSEVQEESARYLHANMFPTYDALPPHETVGARKARKEKEENNPARRSSTSTSLSSGSSVKDTKPAGRSAFGGLFSKSKDRQIQEIPIQKKNLLRQPEPEPELESSFSPSVTPSIAPPASDWGAALEAPHHDAYRRQLQQSYQPPPQPSYQDQERQILLSHKPKYPSPPPLGALPPPPSSTSGSSRSAGTCVVWLGRLEKTWPPWQGLIGV
jgi:hypothetical protein